MSGYTIQDCRRGERGTMLLVVLFIATAVAALAAISSGRVVAETRMQDALENGAQAFNDAMGQLQLAMSVVNSSAYDDGNHNLELQSAMDGDYGGTVAGDPDPGEEWLHDPDGVFYGHVRDTNGRVCRGADYIRRLAKRKGGTVPAQVDPGNLSSRYFVIEALGQSHDVTRLVSALVRENQPFSSFVFFQNRHTLGISGAPRGLIHSNDRVAFYFPDGSYVDGISAVNGVEYTAGATEENTTATDVNPAAAPISLEAIDFEKLRSEANLFNGTPGLDAEIHFSGDGTARIVEFTKPHYEMVEHVFSETYVSGYEDITVSTTQQVQTGTTTEERTRQVIDHYDTEYYTVDVPVYEWQDVTKTRDVAVYEWVDVTRTRQVPIYETQTLTGTRWVQVFVPYDDGNAGGGTAVGGDGTTVPGEYVWVEETYEYQGQVVVGYDTETYVVSEKVQTGTVTETWVESVRVQTGTVTEERTRDVPVYVTETYTVEVPVYEDVVVDEIQSVPVYDTRTWTELVEEYFPPVRMSDTTVNTKSVGGTIFIDGRITRLEGQLNGRVTVVGNEKVRVTGSITYVDDQGDTVMLNGADYTQPYVRNPDYDGDSVLGVVSRDDLLLTRLMPNEAEVDGTLMSTTGRVGIDGFSISEAGDPVKDPYAFLTPEERKVEQAYDKASWAYKSRSFTRDSLRRMGGIISNDRILETYIMPRSDGTSYVDSGFKRGSMRFDINLLFNPPPNFVEVPRPVLNYYAPIFFVRGDEE